MRHAVIMAGGAGTRLWPLSRRERPKQLLRLFDGRSLLRIARERLAKLFEPANIWVITSAGYLDQVADELGDVPRENLIGEPVGRDTANAIGLAARLLAARDPDATMAVFTADHIIKPLDVFAAAIRVGLEAAEAEREALVTFGIMPTSPHTGYGYVQMGERVMDGDQAGRGGPPVYRVRAFKEKPPLERAREYFRSGAYLWNSGMFVWRVEAILRELARLLPANAATLERVARDWHSPERGAAARDAFGGLPKVSIDYGVMERAQRVLVVPMACHWLDLGSWTAVAESRQPDARGNVAIGERIISVESDGNVLVSDAGRLLVTLGVRDLVVVSAGDATLVCKRSDAQRVKELVDIVRERFESEYD